MGDALPNFSWLIPGELAGMARPRSAADLAALRAHGARALISLTREAPPSEWLAAAGLDGLHVPIVDFTAPTLDQIRTIIAAIDDYRAAGSPVVVHCAGGKGRTGTILACALIARGMAAPEALATVRAARPPSVETAEQEAVIAAYGAEMTGKAPG